MYYPLDQDMDRVGQRDFLLKQGALCGPRACHERSCDQIFIIYSDTVIQIEDTCEKDKITDDGHIWLQFSKNGIYQRLSINANLMNDK